MTGRGTQVAAGDQLAAIHQRYRDSLDVHLRVIDDAASAGLADHLTAELRAAARRGAHKLAGSAGTFGFPAATELARQIERVLDGEDRVAERDLLRLSQWAVALRAALDDAQPWAADAAVPPARAPAGPPAGLAAAASRTGSAAEPGRGRLVIVGDGGGDAGRALIMEGEARGFDADVVAASGLAEQLATGLLPAAVVLTLADGGVGAEWRALLAALAAAEVPAVVTATAGGLDDRIEMARLGTRGYLPRSAPAGQVLDAVERALDGARLSGMTVLAVDDDRAVLQTLTALLEPLGLHVHTLDDPAHLWETLDRVRPDLLTLDVDMPGVSGFDLCRVVRSDPRWALLPVLFLTVSADASTARRVFAAGADDYVTKPVVGAELVMRIANRLERLRLYRRLAETDPLTGVANRRKATEELTRLIRLARRHSSPLTVALLDLDRFKEVNDTHGHAAGDEVLRELAAHLQRGFRGEDVVARWGGEEFLVGMYGTHTTGAVKRLSELLVSFRARTFRTRDGTSFRASFSAGVAELTGSGDDIGALYRKADAVLYAAKESGRGQVLGPEDAAASRATYVDVAVIEDDEALGPLLLHALQSRGLRTEWLRDGEVAAQRMTGRPPALRARVAVLDWELPGLDGAGVLRRLADDGVLESTRVVMLTARTREDEVLRVLEAGAADHVAKPFSLPVLLQRIHRQLTSGPS